MDDILARMRQAGFQPKPNVDEDFPAVKGEYRVVINKLKPWNDKDSGEKTAYCCEFKVTETLSGDVADNRNFTKWYRIAGTKFDNNHRVAVTPEDAGKAIMAMASDLVTCGVQLNLGGTIEDMEADFPKAIGAVGYMRAWHFPAKDDADKKIQQFVIKTEKDLRKESKGEAAKSQVPF